MIGVSQGLPFPGALGAVTPPEALGVGWVARYILSVARFVYPAPALYATIRKKVSMGEGAQACCSKKLQQLTVFMNL